MLFRLEFRAQVLEGEDQRLKKPGVLIMMTGGVRQSTASKALLIGGILWVGLCDSPFRHGLSKRF